MVNAGTYLYDGAPCFSWVYHSASAFLSNQYQLTPRGGVLVGCFIIFRWTKNKAIHVVKRLIERRGCWRPLPHSSSLVCARKAGMQRRTVGKGQAHISPPKGSPSRMGGQDSEAPSRLSRRNFGVTNRIWIILSLILTVLILSRYFLSSSSPSSAGGHRILSSDLKPKNYLNATELQHRESPFAFCPVYGEGDEVGKKYGALALTKSRVHLGSGARIQRVVNKAMSGLPVTISVIGGSGTFCLASFFLSWHSPICRAATLRCLWVYVGRIPDIDIRSSLFLSQAY